VPERPAAAVAAAVAVPCAEDKGPLFEGGGPVLLPPSFWEKAGWGIVALAALGLAMAGPIAVC
jgi:hypothetical protein